MSKYLQALEQMQDWEIDQVNRYLKGEHVHYKRGRYEREHVTACMRGVIERACGIHAKGIEVGAFYIGRYKREVRRKKRYWDRVIAGLTTNTQRGFERERREAQERRGLKNEIQNGCNRSSMAVKNSNTSGHS